MRSSTLLALSTLTLLAPACSRLSEEDAAVAFGATMVAVSQGQSQAQVAAQSGTPVVEGEDASFRAAGVTPRAAGNVDFTWNCLGGGTAVYSGAAELVADGAGAGEVSFDLATSFDACSVNGITIDGEFTYALDVVATADSASSEMTMKGELSYDGQVEGSCEWDLKMSFAASNLGSGGGTATASFSGSICGHDASSTLKVGA